MTGSGSSFIPQRPTRGKVNAKSFRKVYVLSYVSYLVFFSTLVAVLGIFFYMLTLETELSNLQQELVSQQNVFNQTDLDRVKRLNYRIEAAKQLISNHVSIVTVLDALDATVIDPVQLMSFGYSRIEDERQPTLTLAALAGNFNQVIFQEQVLDNHPVTSNFGIDTIGLSSQPIDPENLALGSTQVVNVTLTSDLTVSDINFTGRTQNLNTVDNTTFDVPEFVPGDDTVDSDTVIEADGLTTEVDEEAAPADTSDTTGDDSVPNSDQ